MHRWTFIEDITRFISAIATDVFNINTVPVQQLERNETKANP